MNMNRKNYHMKWEIKSQNSLTLSHAEITFAMMAQNLIEAQDKAKRMPSVKHSRGILMGREITEEEYYERRKISAYDRVYGGK